MLWLKIAFWSLLFFPAYAYLGYGLLLFVLVSIKRLTKKTTDLTPLGPDDPEVTLFIAAFNEKEVIEAKMANCRKLDYPKSKLRIVWVTDGSDDGTPELLTKYPEATVLHQATRGGKIGAINRGMQFVDSPIVVFCDANTLLSPDSVRRMVTLFSDPATGCVSGEKRIVAKDRDAAAGAGEGLYWKYESTLKKWDSELFSVVGAAGELFAIRRELFQEVERDTILDDFIISLRIAQKGFRIRYDPEAYAIETASANIDEELKRKVRIAAGGIQSVIRLWPLLNIFKYKILAFQYLSHRVLRWTLAPLSLVLLLPIGFILAFSEGFEQAGLYSILFWLQMVFYLTALAGWYLANHSIRVKILFVPYYFFIMNLSVILGIIRYFRGQQSVNWERAKRA